VIGWVDLCSPDVEEQIVQFSANPKLVGVRHVIHDEQDDDFMLSDSFLRGIAYLQKYGLAYDVLVFPRHLPNTIRLVSQFPGQVFILDHIAKPLFDRTPDAFEYWDKNPGLVSRILIHVTE